ncbi:four helix bundle protein [Marinifilum sp. D737]|uniref:four helix bundle protein n=1 Tax=Marinifilum sp. D737 TaxID=2969628 RepID=UPI002272CA51|nr:four helix bundle protein [Marinifilum sp. D737]MCY1633334.1 four helix bundle protein [Marinifilum sp. D737]
MNENTVKTKSFKFAIRTVHLYKYLCDEKKEFVLSKKILRSGTSIGANVRESQNAESKADFIHKLGIAQKETDETLYWLELLVATDYIEEKLFQSLNYDAEEILKILRSIIISSKNNKG